MTPNLPNILEGLQNSEGPSREIRDDDGKIVKVGDRIYFAYGIPGNRAEGPIVEIKGMLYVLTPGHTPDRCKLSDLRKHVGHFWKIEKSRALQAKQEQP